jgi:hypothetical protein
MTGRLFTTLVAIVALAGPAVAGAQESGYDDAPPLSTTPTPTTPAPAPEPEPEEPVTAPQDDEEENVEEPVATTQTPAPATPAAAAPRAAASPPSRLAYTGSEAWLLALLGVLAVGAGAALLRPSRRT